MLRQFSELGNNAQNGVQQVCPCPCLGQCLAKEGRDIQSAWPGAAVAAISARCGDGSDDDQ